MSFLVGHRKEIKARVKSFPHGAVFTFPIVSHMPVLRIWEHSFAFQSKLRGMGWYATSPASYFAVKIGILPITKNGVDLGVPASHSCKTHLSNGICL